MDGCGDTSIAVVHAAMPYNIVMDLAKRSGAVRLMDLATGTASWRTVQAAGTRAYRRRCRDGPVSWMFELGQVGQHGAGQGFQQRPIQARWWLHGRVLVKRMGTVVFCQGNAACMRRVCCDADHQGKAVLEAN